MMISPSRSRYQKGADRRFLTSRWSAILLSEACTVNHHTDLNVVYDRIRGVYKYIPDCRVFRLRIQTNLLNHHASHLHTWPTLV